VFAGANGSGKSNFFDALDFVGRFVNGGLEIALHAHGGFENILSAMREGADSKKFSFEIECDLLEQEEVYYSLSINDLNSGPGIKECLEFNEEQTKEDKVEINSVGERLVVSEDRISYEDRIYSNLSLEHRNHPLTKLLRNLNVYRIDPTGAKEPDKSDFDSTRLGSKGNNLASVLHRLESDEAIREEIQDWMEMIVPGIENVQTKHQRLDSRTALRFKEAGIESPFPAHLVSDGTMYALCLLVAVLSALVPVILSNGSVRWATNFNVNNRRRKTVV
ncbi:MAG: ATP-binding protein, partial [Gemmatimonadetes bacterium]|nr:ATP-binding protein [Gemmatimonadota bacterium]